MSADVQSEVSRNATAVQPQFKKPEAVTAIVAGEQFGLPGERLVLEIPVESPKFAALSAVSFAATADNSTAEDSVKDFLRALLIRGRVSFPTKERSLAPHLNVRKSHELVRTPKGLVLSRNFFDCGFD